jgi:hypothetical protein
MISYEEAKNWLQSKVHTTIKNGNDDFVFMMQVLQQHPNFNEWKHQNAEYFVITRSPKKKYLQVMVKFEGFKNPRLVSWVECVTQKLRHVDKLTQAMRSAISPQISDYRNRNPIRKCVLCKCDYEPRIEVDHYPILFSTIKKLYLDNVDSLPEKFRFTKGRYYFKENDIDWKTQWELFHAQNAQYRYLCDICNRSNK